MAEETRKTPTAVASDADLDRLEAKQAKAPAAGRAWQDEVRLLVPQKPFTETIEGHDLYFACPKSAVWLAALEPLQEAFASAKALNPDSNPMALLYTAWVSWELPTVIAKYGHSVCAVLDLFLAKETGWTEKNLTPFGVLACAMNFLRVVPAEQIRLFFGPMAARHFAQLGAIMQIALAESAFPAPGSASSSPASATPIPASTGASAKSESSSS